MKNYDVPALIKNFLASMDPEKYPESYDMLKNVQRNAEEGCEMAVQSLAILLFQLDHTETLDKNVAAFLDSYYHDTADEGDADDACNLGSLYYTGRIGEQNYKKAMGLYALAAKNGSEEAAENLGYCYYYGRDTEVDYEKAFQYFSMGAFRGRVISLYKVGDMYRNGYFVEKSPSLAYDIYRRCEGLLDDFWMDECGADVYARLGDCYADGIGTEKDALIALEYYQKAEILFYNRLLGGDFLIRNVYERCIERQGELRKALRREIPEYNWTK